MIRLLQESVKMLQGHAGNSLSSPKFMELTMKVLYSYIETSLIRPAKGHVHIKGLVGAFHFLY